MNTAFGLDIAGYSEGKSGFVQADRKDDNSIEITIFQGHAFSEKHDTRTSLEHIAEREKELLISCCKKGRLLVDIPIDLQGLPYPNNVRFIWELVKRPVDFAFDALPPLADRIGSPVARLAKIANCLKLTSEEEITLNDDELDAIICAMKKPKKVMDLYVPHTS